MNLDDPKIRKIRENLELPDTIQSYIKCEAVMLAQDLSEHLKAVDEPLLACHLERHIRQTAKKWTREAKNLG